MKTLKIVIAVMGAVLAASSTALAHEGMNHPAGNGLFGLPPEYVHILINPMPVYGMAMGILALGAALLLRNKAAQIIGIGLVIIAATSAWPVAHYGLNAYKHVRGLADDAGADALDEHMERADKVVLIFYATAILGVVALIGRKVFPKTATPLAAITLLAATVSLGAGGWISKAGGQVRHPEFRVMSAASTNAESHEHCASGHSHEKMPAEASDHHHEMPTSDQAASTNTPAHHHDESGHAHESMPPAETGHTHETTTSDHTPSTDAPAHEKMRPADTSGHHHEMPASNQNSLPNTIEGVWKEIHEHHGELKASVIAKEFKQVQLHAAMIRDLAKRLAELAPSVEGGIGKIIHTLNELKSSAETGSDTVMKIRFKEFEAAIAELEPPMKKP